MPVELLKNHPDSQQAWSEWSESETLHVASAYSNPFRWRTRRELCNDFRRHVEHSPNVKLYLGELAYGDRPWEVTDKSHNHLDVQLRTKHELFHKENILNQVIRTFPSDWEYGAYVDCDFHFTRHDWALEAIHQLQHYDFVQLFSSYSDLSGKLYGQAYKVVRTNPSFAYNYINNNFTIAKGYLSGGWKKDGNDDDDYYEEAMGLRPRGVGATGGAWAFRRSAFEAVGGLLDKCILGHADWFMAFGLIGQTAPDMHIGGYTKDYVDTIRVWQQNAARLRKNIGYIDCYAIHYWHGPKQKRAYSSRDLILVKNEFTPSTDLFKDYQGIYQLTEEKPDMRDTIRQYFISRYEDLPV